MKKIFLLSILLFQLTFVFGQVKTENKKGYGMATGDYKPNRQETPTQNNNVNKNDRSYQNSCYTGFAFTVKNYGYNQNGGFYSWGVAVKNNYSKAVQLKYKLIVGNDNPRDGTLTYYIKPGSTYSNDFGMVSAIIVNSNSDQYRIEISDVCFEGQDCIKNGYADCNGKQSKTTNGNSTSANSNNNSTNQTNNSNQQTTQQNDLSEYNRSKADLERQMAEKNAEITRQNEENARLGQIWNNAIKAGVDAHNSGNYTEAKNQFTIAINNSSNESNRQNAQNYYNKSVEAEERNRKQQLYDNSFNQAQKSLENKDYTGAMQSYGEAGKNAPTKGQKNVALGGVLASGTIGILDEIKKAKEEKIERERKEAISKDLAQRQLFLDAENGIYVAEVKVAENYFRDKKYDLAEVYYKKAMQNSNAETYQKFMVTDELITTLALQDKNNEIIELLNFYKENNGNGGTEIERIITYLQINCDEYLTGFGNCDENVISEGIKKLAKMQIFSQDIAYYAYLQVLGKHEKYGLAKNEKYGLKALDQIIHGKYDTHKPIAYYYLGMLYLQGTDAIEKDEKKALKYFMKGYERSKKELTFAPPYPAYRAYDAYFNDRILIYLKMAELYSQSTDKDDKELGILMLDRFYKFYKGLIPNSDKKYFKEFATITSTTTANNSITTKSQKISEELLEKAENILDKYKGQNPKKTTITENDQKQAIDYLKQSITLGNLDAYQELYFVYEKIGDYKTAQFYINEEIKANPNATYPLLKMGYYYQDGEGMTKNYLKAVQYYEKTLEINNTDISAEYKLGQIYRDGGFGVEKDLVKAKYFFNRCCEEHNYKEACEENNKIK